MRQIVLDTETTGLEPTQGHRIIEIGCVEMINRSFTDNNFHRYYNPERESDEGALNVHGIDADFLVDKPRFHDVIEEFIDYINGAELIIHNAVFDVGFLDHEFKNCPKKLKKVKHYCGIIDTLAIARKKHPGQRNSLDALCKRYHIDNKHRELHGALLDAKLLAQVYLAMTGGQTSFFDDLQSHQTSEQHQERSQQAIERKRGLPVIKANDMEQRLHQEYLAKITG